MMKYFKELLADRKNPYEIDTELAIRKWLERNTSYRYEFQKNEHPYEYDIICFRYEIKGPEWSKHTLCYIEVEVSESWVNEWPAYWSTYSFLKRKVYNYNHDELSWTTNLKENAEHTIYIIFNKEITDCFACEIDIIASFKEYTIRKTGRNYNNVMLRTTMIDHRVSRGMDNCINKIKEFIFTNLIEHVNLLIFKSEQ